MIADTKLSFARITKGGVSENYMFADMSEPMRRGERTSDFLAFFGFGSGNFNGHIVNKELEGNVMLPSGFSPQRVRVSLRSQDEAVEQDLDWNVATTAGGA